MNLTEKMEEARSMLYLPLDNLATERQFKDRVQRFNPIVGGYKVGMGSHTRFGTKAIDWVHEAGGKVFLDLKYKDIPNTVEDAAQAAAEHGVELFNVHATGGYDMMQAAMEGATDGSQSSGVMPKVIAVTVLTSLDEMRLLETFGPIYPALHSIDFRQYAIGKDDEELMAEFQGVIEEYGLKGVVQNQVNHLAGLTHLAGLDGIVCAAADLPSLSLPEGFMKVNPGIKGMNAAVGGDQARIATAPNAVKWGSDYLVVGRALTDPRTKEQKAANVNVTHEMQMEAGYTMLEAMAEHL